MNSQPSSRSTGVSVPPASTSAMEPILLQDCLATSESTRAVFADADHGEQLLTWAWANNQQRQRVIELAQSEGRQTMNLRTMPGAKLVVLLRADGHFAGWLGVDVCTDRLRPEVFSQWVYPQFRGKGLGELLEHFGLAYFDRHGCATAYMRMELDSNQTLFEHRLRSGRYRQISPSELGQPFVAACRNCELFRTVCHRQAFLAVDVPKALAIANRLRGPLNVDLLALLEKS